MTTQPSLPESRSRRCPRLGSEITFEYCLKYASEEGPCCKVCDCWWERFDVVAYLHRTLGSEAVKNLQASQPPSKVTRLVELIEQARTRCGILPSDSKVSHKET